MINPSKSPREPSEIIQPANRAVKLTPAEPTWDTCPNMSLIKSQESKGEIKSLAQDWSSAPNGNVGPSRDSKRDLTIVIPAFNEESGLPGVLEKLREHCAHRVREIILVDDGSIDATGDLAKAAGITVLRHPSNRGYGASLKSGIRAAQTPYVLIMDAEGQHSPADIWRLWESDSHFDMVVGARQGLFHSPLWRMPGKWLLTRVANHLVKRRIPDLNSGFRLFRKESVAKYMHLCPNGFSFTSTITMAFLSRGFSVDYVPIVVAPRQGHSTVTVGTGLDTLLLLLRLASLFNPLRVFVPASLFFALVGLLWSLPYVLLGHGVTVGSLMAFVTSILLFGLGMICDQISQLRLERFE